jgi:hypothetical protein
MLFVKVQCNAIQHNADAPPRSDSGLDESQSPDEKEKPLPLNRAYLNANAGND